VESPSNKSSLLGLVPVLALVVIIVVGYFLIAPSISALSDTENKIATSEANIKQYQNRIDTLTSLQTQVNQNADILKKISLAYPSNDQMPEILVQIENMARTSNLGVNTIQPTKSSTDLIVPINLSIQGDYIGFKAFLTKMENNIRTMNIKSINLSSSVKKDEGSMINATLNMEIVKAGGVK
jgi:Tfp pilus assembly protein PilO